MKYLILLIMVLNLTACCSGQSFDCPFKEGVKCISVSEVDKQINSGQISDVPPVTKSNKGPCNAAYFEGPGDVMGLAKPPIRTKEEIAEIWIAAYEAQDGIYHQPTVVNTVLREATWLGSVSEIKVE